MRSTPASMKRRSIWAKTAPASRMWRFPFTSISQRKSSMKKCDECSITPARCFARWLPLPRSLNSSGTSTMNISVNIGSGQDFRLSRALLVYGNSSYQGYPYRHPFVTLHEVMHDGDVARLAEGQLMTPQML